MELEKEWESYPVIHLDLSDAKNQESSDGLRDALLLLLKPIVDEYGRDEDEKLLKRLGISVTCEPRYEVNRLYHK